MCGEIVTYGGLIKYVNLLRTMGARFLTIEERIYTLGREKARMNSVVMVWNWRCQYELSFLSEYLHIYTDG